jgi:hypothetical protein
MSRHRVQAVTAHAIVDAVLDRYRGELGDHTPTYHNHVYRCITYHQLLLDAPSQTSLPSHGPHTILAFGLPLPSTTSPPESLQVPPDLFQADSGLLPAGLAAQHQLVGVIVVQQVLVIA